MGEEKIVVRRCRELSKQVSAIDETGDSYTVGAWKKQKRHGERSPPNVLD
jgi:hypothetical protein